MKKLGFIILLFFINSISYAIYETELEDYTPSEKQFLLDLRKKENKEENNIKKTILEKNEKQQKIDELKEELRKQIEKELKEKQKKKELLLKEIKYVKILNYKKKILERKKGELERKKALLTKFKRQKEFSLLETIGKNIVKNNSGNLDLLKKKIIFLDEKIDLRSFKLKEKTKKRLKIIFKVIAREILKKDLAGKENEIKKIQNSKIIKQKDEFDDLQKIINLQTKINKKKNETTTKIEKQDKNNNTENLEKNSQKQDNNSENIEETSQEDFDIEQILQMQ